MTSSILPAIDIANYTSATLGLDAKALSYLGSVYTTITPETIDDAFVYLQQTVRLFAAHFNVTAIPSLDDVLSFLDSGAAKVFVSQPQLEQLETVKTVDLSRVVLSLAGHIQEEIKLITNKPVGIYLHDLQDAGTVEALLPQMGSHRPPVYVSLANPTAAHALQLAKLSATPIVPATLLTIDAKANPNMISVASLLLANATSDRPDGLFTTLVTDERGIALGLVYSSEESVAESLRTGRGVYQSRKRGLWYKGESSGDVQELVRIALDCDHDCLRFVVRQKGR
ncbi:trifunctional histidinol dehydrogenase, partial [Cryomyces antarcticus]